jgi:hypothetical protein
MLFSNMLGTTPSSSWVCSSPSSTQQPRSYSSSALTRSSLPVPPGMKQPSLQGPQYRHSPRHRRIFILNGRSSLNLISTSSKHNRVEVAYEGVLILPETHYRIANSLALCVLLLHITPRTVPKPEPLPQSTIIICNTRPCMLYSPSDRFLFNLRFLPSSSPSLSSLKDPFFLRCLPSISSANQPPSPRSSALISL